MKLLHQFADAAVIHQIKSVLAAHGIPDMIVSDNGPQFASSEFARFANDYGFTHVTSSPKYPQANGEAERAARTVKQLLKKNKDPYIAQLMYRATPLQNGSSPAELLMSIKLQTKVPVFPTTLKPSTHDFDSIAKKEAAYKDRQHNKTDGMLHENSRISKLVIRSGIEACNVLVKSSHNQKSSIVLDPKSTRNHQTQSNSNHQHLTRRG